MNYKSFNLGDWIGHISGVIEDETTLDGNEMRDLVEFLSTLKQEPCEDAISRQAVLDLVNSDWKYENLEEPIENLPSATPTKCIATVKFSKEDMQELVDEKMKEIVVERKKGHWNTYELAQGGINEKWLECSECMWSNALSIPRKYCPNCGCRMESEE